MRFLLLTTARRGEAAGLRRSAIDGTDWTIPASANKTKIELVRPLSRAAMAIIDAQPRLGEFVFGFNGSRLTSFSNRKRDFIRNCGVTDWRLHDLRRTARTLLSRAGVSPDTAERCLGHVIGGVRNTYDRHDFRAEMATAFEALAAQIERIVNPTDNVTPMRRRKG